MGIYDKKQSISREELKSTFRRDRGIIPGTGGKKYYQPEREKTARELFGPKYGSQISKSDYRSKINELRSAQKSAKTPGERKSINEQIRYLKNQAGKNL